MTGKVLTFYLRDALFGIDITLVKEINRNVEFTSVPGAPEYVAGLFNMRGQVVTLFDLGKMIGFGTGEWKQSSACIILKPFLGDENQVGFLIDAAGDVADIHEELCEPAPANVGGVESEYIHCVGKLKGELIIIIDPKKVFAR